MNEISFTKIDFGNYKNYKCMIIVGNEIKFDIIWNYKYVAIKVQ